MSAERVVQDTEKPGIVLYAEEGKQAEEWSRLLNKLGVSFEVRLPVCIGVPELKYGEMTFIGDDRIHHILAAIAPEAYRDLVNG